MTHLRLLSLALLFNLLLCAVNSQNSTTRSYSPQAVNAIKYFDSGNFQLSIEEFKKLHQKYSKDPMYEYYLGVSMVKENRDLNEAIELLKSASSKNVPHDVNYYLGLAFFRTFQFEKALDSFNDFKQNASWQEQRKLNISKQIEQVQLAKSFCQNSIDLEVSNVNRVKANKSSEFKLKLEIPGYSAEYLNDLIDTNSFVIDGKEVVFLSEQANNKFYFATKENKGAKGGEIVQHSGKNEYEILGKAINTSDDEACPFFLNGKSELYFSSKGHNSIGGYDIFKSTYDEKQQKWSEPEQLPFPFNSQYNDFLIALDKDKIILASDRETGSGELGFYFIKTPQEIKATKKLVNSLEMQQACVFQQSVKIKTKQKKSEMALSNQESKRSTVNFSDGYFKFISQSLESQKRADSVQSEINNLKVKLAGTEDSKERAAIFSEIARKERIMANFQAIADSFYTKINKFDNRANETNSKVVVNEEKRAKTDVKLSNEFSITAVSPYTSNNPFPMDVNIPGDLIYRIQLGAYSKAMNFDYFGGIQPISGETLQEGKIIKYYAGIFRQFDFANESLKKVHEAGFKDAFIVAYLNGKKIPLERAKELEKK